MIETEKLISIYELIAYSIDFEGSISIRRSIKNNHSRYSIQVKISNTNLDLLEVFKNRVEFGKIYGPRKLENRRDQYDWILNKEEMKIYLPLILPYLNVKWRQCQLAIEVLTISKNIKYTKYLTNKEKQEIYTWEEICILESCYKECQKLNKEGYIKCL